MFFYDAARQHKIRKKDGNGSGGSDLISGQLALFEKIIYMHGAEQLSAVPSIKLLVENWLGEMP